jgi:hypothetical protein
VSSSAPRRPRFWLRCTALAGVALVLALGVFGANADWHAVLHAHDDAHHEPHTDDAGCAVELFASGVDTPVESPSAPLVARRVAEILRAVAAVDVAAPEYRLLPSQAPPVG